MGLLSEQRTMQKFTKHKIKTDLITPLPFFDEGGTIDVSGPFLCFFLHYRYKIRQK